jgi:hypothetical protein
LADLPDTVGGVPHCGGIRAGIGHHHARIVKKFPQFIDNNR